MAITLIESAKTMDPGLNRAVIEIYAKESPILGVLPFMDIGGNAYKYNIEDTLPGIGFRGVNEAYPESTGVLNPKVETLAIAGGDADVDTFILKTNPGRRPIETSLKIKAMSLAWGAKFIKGDNIGSPAEFDGLQSRLVGNQVINNGATSGGDALSIFNLDRTIKQTYNPTHILVDKGLTLLITQAARTTAIGGFITYSKDEFGRQVTMYAGLPILEMGEDNTGVSTLGFTEANPGGGTPASSSIYVVSLNADTLFGIQSGVIQARDLGELQSKPAVRTRVEWFSGFVVSHPRAATRLRGIKNATAVA